MALVQIGEDLRRTFDFYGCRHGDAGLEVSQETWDRWRATHDAWMAMQRELRALHEAGAPDLGDRLPVDDEEEEV